MGNNVSIRTTAPGAKEAAGQVKSLSDAYEKLAGGSAKAKLAGAAVAGGFALATKGALEMEDAQKTFIQTTGKSGEAAVAFSKDMNSIVGTSKTVGMGFDEIVETGANVENQFNTTGDATRQLTEDVVGFAKVTGQDASDAAGQLEDALSAFGLGAEDAAGMMDVLVASSQTFGTDVGPETLDQLKKMAPALQAMGIGAEDAVGFLNLFEGAGLDAAGAMKGFNAAITNIPPGENLKSVLEKVQAIEDPLLRAKYASEIFGAKAGAGLANALKPGGVALEDYILTTEEAVGAVDQTADDMLTSTDKIKMFGEKVGGVFRDTGETFGPFITGLASVGTLMSPALSAAWGAVSNSPAVKAAATAAGIQSGSIFAAAAAFAIPLAAKGIGDEFHKAFSNFLTGGQGDPINNAFHNAAVNYGIEAGSTAAATTAETFAGELPGAITTFGPQVPPGYFEDVGVRIGEDIGVGAGHGLVKYKTDFADDARETTMFAIRAMENEAANADRVSDALADGLLDSIPDVRDAWDQYIEESKNALNPMKEIAWLEARLSGDKLAEGLESKNPLTRRRAEAMRDSMIEELGELQQLMGIEGTQGSNALANHLDAAGPAAAAAEIARRVNAALDRIDTHRQIYINRVNGPDKQAGARAKGGPVEAGKPYLVNEDTPNSEIFIPGASGYIAPRDKFDSNMGPYGGRGGSGGAPIQVHVHLSTREFRSQSRHDSVIQQGAPAFR